MSSSSTSSPNIKRKPNADNACTLTTSPQWKTHKVQNIYSSNLISALRNIHRRGRSGDGGRSVRVTADKVLAATARGRTRWSRAILTSRLSRRLYQINRAKARTGLKRNKPGSKKNEPGLKKKVCLLGKLVPGCSKVSFPKLLEEASDYIAALQMQVRAMSVLTEVLGGGATSSPPLV